ncbi:ATP-binding protein, partial [Staphylococcus haemolyticus]|uniref:ATP-binding protein n=1 Tax=Staphylococcus haemolyticus TaxID=1283 RepID=UPI001E4676E9
MNVDPAQFEAALLNLVVNARDALGDRGRITVQTRQIQVKAGEAPAVAPGDYICVSVSDHGSGRDPGVMGRVFEPFFTTKAEGAGTGLGLAMAYGFVAQSGGHIDIDGVPGAGTTVRLFLPRSTASESAALDATGPAPQGGNEHILVVEDDAAVRDSVCTMLGQLGYRVRSAGDAQSALDMLRQGVPADLV